MKPLRARFDWSPCCVSRKYDKLTSLAPRMNRDGIVDVTFKTSHSAESHTMRNAELKHTEGGVRYPPAPAPCNRTTWDFHVGRALGLLRGKREDQGDCRQHTQILQLKPARNRPDSATIPALKCCAFDTYETLQSFSNQKASAMCYSLLEWNV